MAWEIAVADEPRDLFFGVYGFLCPARRKRLAELNQQNLRRRGRLPVPKKAPWELLERRKLLLVQVP
jgi:hypothetical protein